MYTAYRLNKQGDNTQPWHTPFLILESVYCSMSSSNCCFLTCIQISQEAHKVVWYSHLLSFPHFVVLHTVRGFSLVIEAKIDVFFLKFSCFFYEPEDLPIWSLVPLPFLNPTWTSISYRFTYCCSLAWRILNITSLACESIIDIISWCISSQRNKSRRNLKLWKYIHITGWQWSINMVK